MSTPVYFAPTLVKGPDIELKKIAVKAEKGLPANEQITSQELEKWDVYQCPGEKNYSVANDRTKRRDFSPPLACSRPLSFAEKLNEMFGVNGPPTSYQKNKAIVGFTLAVVGTTTLVAGLTLFGVGQYDLSHNGEGYYNPNYDKSFNMRTGGIATFITGGVMAGVGLGMLIALP